MQSNIARILGAGLSHAGASLLATLGQAAGIGLAPSFKPKRENKYNQRVHDPVQAKAIAEHNAAIDARKEEKRAASLNIGKHSVSARQAKKTRKLLKLKGINV